MTKFWESRREEERDQVNMKETARANDMRNENVGRITRDEIVNDLKKRKLGKSSYMDAIQSRNDGIIS